MSPDTSSASFAPSNHVQHARPHRLLLCSALSPVVAAQLFKAIPSRDPPPPPPVTRQDFHPRIHITDSDFASITEDGALCDARGQLGPHEFADVIRRQARPARGRLESILTKCGIMMGRVWTHCGETCLFAD